MSTHNCIHDNDDPEGLKPQFNSSANPFNAGDDYFERFAAKIQNSVDTFEEIRNEAPILSNIPKYNPFDVPAGYFDELPTVVQQRCIDAAKKPAFAEWLSMLFRPRFAIAVLTTVLIAVSGIYYTRQTGVTNTIPAVAEEITVDEQLQNIDETTIVEELTADADLAVIADPQDDIVDYLMESDIDETSLNVEL